mgnify:CR=1 FL=1
MSLELEPVPLCPLVVLISNIVEGPLIGRVAFITPLRDFQQPGEAKAFPLTATFFIGERRAHVLTTEVPCVFWQLWTLQSHFFSFALFLSPIIFILALFFLSPAPTISLLFTHTYMYTWVCTCMHAYKHTYTEIILSGVFGCLFLPSLF